MWGRKRELPAAPAETFRELNRKRIARAARWRRDHGEQPRHHLGIGEAESAGGRWSCQRLRTRVDDLSRSAGEVYRSARTGRRQNDRRPAITRDLNEQLRKLPQSRSARKLRRSCRRRLAECRSGGASIRRTRSRMSMSPFCRANSPWPKTPPFGSPITICRSELLYFLCQHLVLVVRGDAIVDHMHAAYARMRDIAKAASLRFADADFRRFHLGPLEDGRYRAVARDRRPRSAVAHRLSPGQVIAQAVEQVATRRAANSPHPPYIDAASFRGTIIGYAFCRHRCLISYHNSHQ